MFPKVADALQGDVPIIMDSGIHRGTDVTKALALGAGAVAVGRPLMYGLTVGGPVEFPARTGEHRAPLRREQRRGAGSPTRRAGLTRDESGAL